MTKPFCTLLPLLAVLLSACTNAPKQYKIGVSQCSEDIWREKQNAELRMAAYLHDNVELHFAAAYDSDERQVQQIDSLVSEGIQLLIVAPNQVATISPAIDRAFDRGIPVIVFERKTNSKKYTAFISADNYEMGRVMGQYMATQLSGQGRVMEVMGLNGSSPAIDRHKGFADAISQYPGIELVATLQGDWTHQSSHHATSQWLAAHPHTTIDYVFAQNDRMAMGARQAFSEHLSPAKPLPHFCGIDGLPGKDGGIQLVRDSLLDASYIYPTHGDKLLSQALDILEGRPYQKEVLLMSALVTPDNARVLLMQSEEIERQSGYLDNLHNKANEYLSQLDTQRAVTILACGTILLLLLVFLLFYLYQQGKISLRRQRVVSNLWNMEKPESLTPSPSSIGEGTIYQQAQEQEQEQAQEQGKILYTPLSNRRGDGGEATFISRFKEVVESQLPNSELSVEDLAAQMNLSRVQLYRKVKSISGSSPVELLRTARLNRGYQMLLTTDKTVSEVAYAVGFTAPSYFTKCFKEEFGVSPTDLKK